MEILGLGNVNRIDPGNANRVQSQAQKQRPIYNLGDEKTAQIYTGGLMVRIGTPLDEIKRLYIEDTLSRHKDKAETAKALDLKEGNLNRKLRRYGLGG